MAYTRDLSRYPEWLKRLKIWVVASGDQTDKPDPKRPGKFKLDKAPKQSLNPQWGADSTDPRTWSSFEDAVNSSIHSDDHPNSIVGHVLGEIEAGKFLVGSDGDLCFGTEVKGCASKAWDDLMAGMPQTYTEVSLSGDGLHRLWLMSELPTTAGAKHGSFEFYAKDRYFAVTGRAVNSRPVEFLSKTDAEALIGRIKSSPAQSAPAAASAPKSDSKVSLLMEGRWQEAGYASQSDADLWFVGHLLRRLRDPKMVDRFFRATGLMRAKWDERRGEKTYGEMTIAKALSELKISAQDMVDPDSWRDGFKSFHQLSPEPPKFLIGGVIPEKALTAIPAPSYNCKSWVALAAGKALAMGENLWCFDGPKQPVKVAYHVPEMNESLVRFYMERIGFQDVDPEYFLVRPMECGLWQLDDPRMLRSSEGRCVFLDTAGYFNPADDVANYQQSLKFASLVFNLLQNGALAVVGLFHPPKYAKQENQDWTLENSILGSAGYGGILRSCIRMQNLNQDLNDPNVWVYVQGLKNPGLKPFQLEGPPPLKMRVEPGKSPYLKDLVGVDPRKAKAFAMFEQGKTQREICRELGASPKTVVAWREEFEAMKETDL